MCITSTQRVNLRCKVHLMFASTIRSTRCAVLSVVSHGNRDDQPGGSDLVRFLGACLSGWHSISPARPVFCSSATCDALQVSTVAAYGVPLA